MTPTESGATAAAAFRPAYLALLDRGELDRRVAAAWTHLEDCDLCARYCHVNRRQTTTGAVCRTGERAGVNSYGQHHGEEDPLRGWNGSGTIFFSGCNLRCVFCLNWEISQKGSGRDNLVTPSHVVAQILAAAAIAARRGLRLPLVYNTGGYDSPEALALLDGVIDIYLPDMKYGDSETARQYSKVRNYWEVNQAAVREMYRQVGDLQIDDSGVARRGLLVRHLVLPGDLANTESVLAFLATGISRNTYLNLMDQYFPCYRAWDYPPLDRPITRDEYERAVAVADTYGLRRRDRAAGRRVSA
jgi:putative pyruvate formate lyase activating enzyme